jgi:hypothetical protein
MASGTGSLLGNGTTFVLSAGSVGTIVDMDLPEEVIAIINDDSLAVTTQHELIGGKLTEVGQMTGNVIFNPDSMPPISRTSVTGTITFQPRTGQTTGATLAGTGFVFRRKPTSVENESRIMCEFGFQFDGKTTELAYTAGS